MLYNHDYVLAHPLIETGNLQQPLARLDELDDLVLQRIWTPDDEAAIYLAGADRHRSQRDLLGRQLLPVPVSRHQTYYGPAPWTIGVYLNTTLQTGDQIKNMMRALAAGLAVLVLAIIASVIVGRKVSGPVKEIARAADAVDSRRSRLGRGARQQSIFANSTMPATRSTTW